MKTMSVMLMVLPVAFLYLFQDLSVGARVTTWSLLSIACLGWGVYIRRRQRSLGWCCISICCVEVITFLWNSFNYETSAVA